jgi:hypothetical protein
MYRCIIIGCCLFVSEKQYTNSVEILGLNLVLVKQFDGEAPAA